MKKSILCLLLALLLFGSTGCQGAKKNAPELLEPVGVKMDTATVTRGEIYNTTVYSGEVVPYLEELSFVVDGTLGEVLVQIGDTVKKGEVLATLNNDKIQAQVDSLQTEISNTTKKGEYSDSLAEIDIAIEEEKLAILRESNATAADCTTQELKIEKMKLDLKQAQELRKLELEYKNTSLSDLKQQMDNAEIVAPINGKVVYVTSAKAGSSVSAYSTVIGIADESRLSITTDYIVETYIDAADKIYARILGTEYPVTYIPYDKEKYMSLILSGQTVKSTFTIDGEAPELKSGQFAVVVTIDSYKEDVLTVPSNAIYYDNKGYYVYKIEDDTRVRCDVTVGVHTDIEAEIEAGLQEGDEVYVKE